MRGLLRGREREQSVVSCRRAIKSLRRGKKLVWQRLCTTRRLLCLYRNRPLRESSGLIREPADAYQYGTSGGLPAGAATTRKQEGTSVKFLTRVVREHSIDRIYKRRRSR